MRLSPVPMNGMVENGALLLKIVASNISRAYLVIATYLAATSNAAHAWHPTSAARLMARLQAAS
jgi:hypothetical protein